VRVASNSSPLIWLSQTGHFDLLREVFGTILIAPAVWAETVDRAAGYPNATNVMAARAAEWLQVITPTDLEKIAVLRAQLHAGEAETLVMAGEQRVDAVLVDDLQARHFATAMGLRVIGMAGVLLLAHARGITVDVKATLDHMRRIGFRLREQVYQDILKRLAQ
jgi:predicted nucleic acid-binding protein